MTTPFEFLAARFTVGRRGLRWATSAALFMSVVLVITGGIVRVTGSGLGCPTWPACTGDSVVATEAMGIHGAIEFTNRMLTWVLCAAVGWVIIAARLQKPWNRAVTRLGWLQFWMVVLNAVVGGITVLTGLNPYIVAAHFVAATLLITAATWTWHRVRVEQDGPPAVVSARAHRLARWLVGVTALLVVVGTVVSGAGPHAGDSRDVYRIPISWTAVTWVHGVIAVLVFAIAIALLRSLSPTDRTARFRTAVFLVVFFAQGLVGLVQSLTGLPELVVALHLLGAALVWVGALRVLLDAPDKVRTFDAPAAVDGKAAPVVAN